MSHQLLIVFIKNNQPGKVKTRLAKHIGDQAASEVYEYLVTATLSCLDAVKAEKQLYFSNHLEDHSFAPYSKFVQEGHDLGERMLHAFKNGFVHGFKKIVLIGSDLPELSAFILNKAFDELEYNDVVFGPAEDGGYYLVGMNNLYTTIFKDKLWSTSNLLKHTLEDLNRKKIKVSMLETLNDIDTFEDLKSYPKLLNLISKHGKIRQ